MEIIKISPKRVERKKIDHIVKHLKKGGVVVLPTDTSYGLAVSALNPRAINRAYKVKKRTRNKPLSVIVRDIDQAKRYGVIDRRTRLLFNKFLPGKLTIIVKRKGKLPKNLTGGRDLVGLRIPDCRIIEKIMEKVNFPITATSANVAGDIEPYSVGEILKQYKNRKQKPDLIVDVGGLRKNKPSTIIDVSKEKIKLIRKGPIKFKDVVNTLK